MCGWGGGTAAGPGGPLAAAAVAAAAATATTPAARARGARLSCSSPLAPSPAHAVRPHRPRVPPPRAAAKIAYKSGPEFKRTSKRTLEERKAAVAAKKEARIASLLAGRAGAEGQEEDDE